MAIENIIINFVTKGLSNLKSNMRGFNQSMAQSMEGFQKQNKANVSAINTGARWGNQIRLLTHGMRGFRMEMLGVMFFGMGMAKFFSGMLKPALELTGMFELFSTVLGVLFLPIAMTLLEILLPIMDWFINLPEGVKMAIGMFAVFGLILGKIIFLVGMFALGIGSLILVFGSVGAGMAVVGLIFGGIIAIVLAVAAVMGIFAAIWKANFLKIRGWMQLMWVGIKQTFTGIWQFLKSVWLIISGLFSGNTDKIVEGFKLMGKAIWNILTGILKFVGGLIMTIALTIIQGIWGIIKSLAGLLIKAVSFLKEKVTNVAGAVSTKIKGGRQIGGFVPHSGLYRLHAGETVSQAGDTLNNAVTINVSGTSNADLVNQIAEAVTRNLANLSRR